MQSAAVLALFFSPVLFDAAQPHSPIELNSRRAHEIADTRVQTLPLPDLLQRQHLEERTSVSPLGTVTTLRSNDRRSYTSTTTHAGEVVFSAAVRQLSHNARVIADNRGGWRLEKTSSSGKLLSLEDQYGLVADVIYDSFDRPVGVILNSRLAVEYIYGEASGLWEHKVLYDLDSGAALAEASKPRSGATWIDEAQGPGAVPEFSEGPTFERTPTNEGLWHFVITLDGTRYASFPAGDRGPVVRSVLIDSQFSDTAGVRIDYTESEMVVHLSTFDSKSEVAVAISRNTGDDGTPLVIVDDHPGADQLLTALTVGAPATALRDNAVPARHKSLSSTVTDVLANGYSVALDRVRNIPACRSLFEPFAFSGNERLMSTFYSPPKVEQRDNSCDRGSLAYTHVGSPVTHLCGSFGNLSPEQAAVVLIHEALHFAGMQEAPYSPGALSTHEINELVLESCGFQPAS